ncbi:MAG: peptidylprolyl isomerase [Prolixibacteraceae bacterium]
MKTFLFTLLLSIFFLNTQAEKTIGCIIKTSSGTIRMELYPKKAPVTVTNFLNYVDHQLYDSTSFFRVCTPENEKDRKIRIQVIQGGEIPEEKQFEPIPIETTRKTGILHLNGTVSMARDTPNSATSSFFICIGDQPELDFAGKRNPDGQGFAAFGKVTKGMKVVREIQAQKEKDQRLVNPILIYSIRRK